MKDWKKNLKQLSINIYRLLFDTWGSEIIEYGTEKITRPKNNSEIMADIYTRKGWNSVTVSTVTYSRHYVIYKYTHKFFKKEKLKKVFL